MKKGAGVKEFFQIVGCIALGIGLLIAIYCGVQLLTADPTPAAKPIVNFGKSDSQLDRENMLMIAGIIAGAFVIGVGIVGLIIGFALKPKRATR